MIKIVTAEERVHISGHLVRVLAKEVNVVDDGVCDDNDNFWWWWWHIWRSVCMSREIFTFSICIKARSVCSFYPLKWSWVLDAWSEMLKKTNKYSHLNCIKTRPSTLGLVMIMVDMMIPTFDPFPRRWTAGRNRLACKGDLRSSEIFIMKQQSYKYHQRWR